MKHEPIFIIATSVVDPDPYMGSVFRSFVDPDSYSQYGSGFTYEDIG